MTYNNDENLKILVNYNGLFTNYVDLDSKTKWGSSFAMKNIYIDGTGTFGGTGIFGGQINLVVKSEMI